MRQHRDLVHRNRRACVLISPFNGIDIAHMKRLIDVNAERRGWLVFATLRHRRRRRPDSAARWRCWTRSPRTLRNPGAALLPMRQALRRSDGRACTVGRTREREPATCDGMRVHVQAAGAAWPAGSTRSPGKRRAARSPNSIAVANNHAQGSAAEIVASFLRHRQGSPSRMSSIAAEHRARAHAGVALATGRWTSLRLRTRISRG